MRQAQAAPSPSRHPLRRIRHTHFTRPAEMMTPDRKSLDKAHFTGENDLSEVVFSL
jgi:hypothetical protein